MADCPPATHTTNHGTGFPFKHPISPAGELKPRPCSKGVQLRQLEQTIRTFLNKMPDRSQAGKCWCSCHTLQGWQSSSVALQPWCKHRHCCNPCGQSVLWFYFQGPGYGTVSQAGIYGTQSALTSWGKKWLFGQTGRYPTVGSRKAAAEKVCKNKCCPDRAPCG